MRPPSKIAVVRAFPRIPEFKFYTTFKQLKVKLIGSDPQIKVFFEKTAPHLENVSLRLKPAWFCDPIGLISGRYTHRSWVIFENLEHHLKDCQVINISDAYYFYCYQSARIAEKLKKPLVTIIWENIPYHPAIFLPPYALNVREVVRNTNLFILRSKSALRFTDSLKIARSRVRVIYKGVDLSRFCPPEGFAPDNKRPVKILYVGQITRSKGVGDLLKVFSWLCREFADLELILAGRMQLRGGLKRFSQKFPIKYLGFVHYSKLPQIYRQADIFCSPSKGKERFSYTLMEAQASGLPIVATRCGGIPEEVGDKNLLADPGDAKGLYQALKRLVEEKDLREEIGRANRKRAEKLFDLKKQAQKTEKAVLSIL
jgi:glycosyltransferase involved in cell wall biosynthesis